jgi:Zn-dependent protease
MQYILRRRHPKEEMEDLFKAWLAISVAFGIVLNEGSLFSVRFVTSFLLAGLTVGIGFLAHELGHRRLAHKFGVFAEFRASNFMLILAIAMSFFGFVFAAPGAVVIAGNVDKRKSGMISAMGPAMNIILAVIFLLIGFAFPSLKILAMYGLWINSWLALFNMIPFGFFDGLKIFVWNKLVYFSLAGAAGALMIINTMLYAA